MRDIETLLFLLIIYIIFRDNLPLLFEVIGKFKRRAAEKKAMRDNLDKIGRADDESDR